ncbi:CLUMA_CG018597, isoform A [Clunio marinus]|uniref:CLUMA_CG018597, isoform A n=1 Tax=Clunio marinus TaxID=568069 RepID=A0A1J1IZF3_9DIPT|nr:CLUMA_CG018597, isoform A [Clunio marinus]
MFLFSYQQTEHNRRVNMIIIVILKFTEISSDSSTKSHFLTRKSSNPRLLKKMGTQFKLINQNKGAFMRTNMLQCCF